jgi:hypothetical protein
MRDPPNPRAAFGFVAERMLLTVDRALGAGSPWTRLTCVVGHADTQSTDRGFVFKTADRTIIGCDGNDANASPREQQ